MGKKLSRSAETLIAVVVLALVAAPVALAAGQNGGQASASAKTSAAKTLGKLSRQVGALQRQVAALEGQKDAARTPTGPAGGDLTGTFPNPRIGPNAVGSEEIAEAAVGLSELAVGSVNGPKIADGTVGTSDLGDSSVDGNKIADDTVAAADLVFDSVGGTELKNLVATVGNGVEITAGGGPAEAKVSCGEGQVLIGGGYAWLDDEANSIIASAPSETNPTHTWIVRGMVAAGSNRLFAWATCLTP